MGLDRVPGKLPKLPSTIVGPSVTKISTSCMDTGIAKSDLHSYRLISVQAPVVSKNFEKIILIYQQLYNYVDKNKLLNVFQCGLPSLHSTMTTLLETTNNWSGNIDNGLLNGVLYIDLKKSSDTIDHAIICENLRITNLIRTPNTFLRPTWLIETRNVMLTEHCLEPANY